MTTTFLMTPAQAERRIKHLEALLKEQVGRRGEDNATRSARWDARIAEAKARGIKPPRNGCYTDAVWLETGEIL